MKVSELAKELNIPSDGILSILKSLKLKAKDANQELSAAVATVIKSEFVKIKKDPAKLAALTKPAPAKVAKVKEVKEPDVKEKKAATKEEKKDKDLKETKATTKAKEKVEKEKEKPKKFEAKPAATPPPSPAPKVEKLEVKKEPAPVIEALKPKVRIGREPVITLKPLLKKKKRMEPGRPSSSLPFEAPAVAQGGVVPTSEKSALAAEPKEVDQSTLVELEIKLPITVKDLSAKLQQKPSVVLKELMGMGLLVHINQTLDGELVNKIAQKFGFKLITVKTQEEQLFESHRKEQDDPKTLKSRPPVVTFMGHVDHGKTSLLDCIRKSKVADSEHGGITQHMGAYSVKIPKGRITFLDTPGHEAFTAMRARGAHITDLVVLVVAADEGIMPQTEEAIDHARAANVPIIVALNKIDKRTANADRVKKQLAELNLMTEDWGGKTICVGVSALTGEGVDNLLDMILLESELLELKANYDKRASGIVVEAHLSQGKGVMATLIVQSGTIRETDVLVVGPTYGKIKAMFDDHGRMIKEAGPSTPVEILGLPEVPEAGEEFYVIADERQARDISSKRQEQLKNEKFQAFKKVTLEDINAKIQEGSVKELNVVVKSDVQGSLEALKDSLEKIPSDKAKVKFLHLGVGDVNASDVLLAAVSKAIIIAFHVGINPNAKEELNRSPVDVREYRIIYDAVNDIKNALEGMLEAKTRKNFLSRIEIRQVFKLSKHGTVAGCFVQKGKVIRKANADVIREGQVVYSGQISSLKRFKDDVREVLEGMECGIAFGNFDKYEVGDIIEAYEIERIAQKL